MKKNIRYGGTREDRSPLMMHDRPIPPSVSNEADGAEAMVRTQIYLTRGQHDFLIAESGRRAIPMAAVLRSMVDEKMTIPEEAWTHNPLLDPPVPDPDWTGHEDSALNHDHYAYGTPKRYMKRDGKWVPSPPLPEDYYENPKSRRAYDKLVMKET